MKSKIRELLTQINIKHSKNLQEKIELVNCPLKEMMCETHLTTIYTSFLESEQYRIEKNFDQSIETLKSAFYKTSELMNHPCTRCAHHYRINIIESLENIRNELGKMTNGFFGKKRYQSIYLKADEVVKEFINDGQINNFQLNESKDRFLGNHLN